jgi:hypothetical protein
MLLLLGVAIVLGGGLLFVRRESAAVGLDTSVTRTLVPPTNTPQSERSAPLTSTAGTAVVSTATPRPADPATSITSPTGAPAGASGATPQATLVHEVSIVRINGTLVALLPGTPTPEIPWWQRIQDTPEPLVRDVMAGYLHFWDVRAQVLSTLQTGLLNAVMADRPLQDELAFLQQLRARNQAQRVDVDHSITVRWATAEQGAVIDVLVDRSSIVDLNPTLPPDPDAPAPTPASKSYVMAFLLQRTLNGWQVVDSRRIVR